MSDKIVELLSSLGGFSEEKFFRLVFSKKSSAWRKELEDDGAPDLELSSKAQLDSVSIDDLLDPLTSHQFPRRKQADVMSITGYMLVGYSLNEVDHSLRHEAQYKCLYIASLFLYCHTMLDAATEEEAGPLAIATILEVCCFLNTEAKMHVVKFLLSLVVSYGENYRQSDWPTLAPRTSLLLACAVIWARMLDPIRAALSQMSEVETICAAWAPSQLAAGGSAEKGIAKLQDQMRQITLENGSTALMNTEIDRILQILSGQTEA